MDTTLDLDNQSLKIEEDEYGLRLLLVGSSKILDVPYHHRQEFIQYLRQTVEALKSREIPTFDMVETPPPQLPELNRDRLLVGLDGRLYKSDGYDWIVERDNTDSNIKLNQLIRDDILTKNNVMTIAGMTHFLGYEDKYFDLKLGTDMLFAYKLLCALTMLRSRTDLPSPNEVLKIGITKNTKFPTDISILYSPEIHITESTWRLKDNFKPQLKLIKEQPYVTAIILYSLFTRGTIDLRDMTTMLSDKTNIMNRLPDDMIREICNKLDPKSMGRFVQTDKRIKRLCTDAVIKKKEEKKRSNEYVAVIFENENFVRSFSGLFYHVDNPLFVNKDIVFLRDDYTLVSTFLFYPTEPYRYGYYYPYQRGDPLRKPIGPVRSTKVAVQRWIKAENLRRIDIMMLSYAEHDLIRGYIVAVDRQRTNT